MSESQAVRDQRKARFMEKMKLKNKGIKSFDKEINTGFSNVNKQTEFLGKNEQMYSNNNINNNTNKGKVHDDGKYLERYTKIGKYKNYKTYVILIKKISIILLSILHCLYYNKITLSKYQIIFTSFILEFTALAIDFTLTYNIKALSPKSNSTPLDQSMQIQSTGSYLEKNFNYIITNYSFIDNFINLFTILKDAFSDYFICLSINIFFIIFSSYKSTL
jgi:hypothetical protein